MSGLAVFTVVAALVFLVVVVELSAAALPMLIVLIFVPPEERPGLAGLLAAIDSSPRLRLWPALRAAVQSRRTARRETAYPVRAKLPGQP